MHARALGLLVALALAGCFGGDPAPAGADRESARTDDAAVEDRTVSFSGAITATPAQPAEEAFPFDVPKGAVGVAATLSWSSPLAALRLDVVDPAGDSPGRAFPEASGRQSVATVEPPRSGEWTAVVSSSRAVEANFTVEVTVSFLVPSRNVLADQVELRAADYAELNLIMEGNASFDWEFSSSATVAWDIHSHEDGETITHDEGTGTEHAANFSAPARQIYSILFESQAAAPVTLSYRVEGAFRVHSHSQ